MAGLIEGSASAVTWRMTDQFAECLTEKGREAEVTPAPELGGPRSQRRRAKAVPGPTCARRMPRFETTSR